MRRLILAVLSVVLLFTMSAPALAFMPDETPDTVYDLASLLEFIEQAEDYDRVYVGATIEIDNISVMVGHEELIRVQLLRADGFTGSFFDIQIQDECEVKIKNIEIWGYGIESEATIIIDNKCQSTSVILDNVRFENCKVNDNGGGVQVVRGNTQLINCSFSWCSALNGGGLYISADGFAFVESSRFSYNDVGLGDGGAIANFGSVVINNSTIMDSKANMGGGIANMGVCEISNCNIRDNIATLTGGGIENSGTLIVNANMIWLNKAPVGNGRDICSDGILEMKKSMSEITQLYKGDSYVITHIGWFYDDLNALSYPDEYYKEYVIPSKSVNNPVKLAFEFQSFDIENNDNDENDPLDGDSPNGSNNDNDSDNPDSPLDGDSGDTNPNDKTDNNTPSPTPDPGNGNNNSPNNNGGYTPPYIPLWSGNSNSSTSTTEDDTDKVTQDTDKLNGVIQEPYKPFVCGDAVLDTSSRAYLLGYGDGLTHENDLLTRAQMVTIICRLLTDESRQAVQTTANGFSDVPTDSWFNEAVSTIANAGVVVGIGNGKFDPNGTLTWSQIITIFARFVELQKDTELQNIEIDSHWAADYIKTAISLGWIADNEDFSPDEPVTRGEMVDFINHLFSVWGVGAT